MSTQVIDAVSLSIMRDRLVGITDEIVSALIRSSFSTIVRESGDLSVVVLDAQGNSIAQGSYSVPSFTGTAATTLRHMLAKFPPDSLEPGDVIATNDAWMGTGHLFDINVMRPVFRNGRIAGYTLSITHLPDIGGLGQEIEFRNDTGAPLTAFCVAPRSEFPAQSLFGGGNGSRRTILIDGRAVHPKGAHTVARDSASPCATRAAGPSASRRTGRGRRSWPMSGRGLSRLASRGRFTVSKSRREIARSPRSRSGGRRSARSRRFRASACPIRHRRRRLRAGRRHLPLPADRREHALPILRPRQLFHVALRRGHLPTREPQDSERRART